MANCCIKFNSEAQHKYKIESYGLAVCEFEAGQEIARRLKGGAEPSECLPLVRLVFIKRNGTFRCSSLYDGDVRVEEVREGFFDEMTRAEKRLLLTPGFSFLEHYQRRADLFHAGDLSTRKRNIAKQADQRWTAIMARWRGELVRSASDGPHGFVPLSMPKGRRQKRSSEVETAIKETKEETGIPAHKLSADSKNSVSIDYVDDGNRYVLKFFPAVLTSAHTLVLDRSTQDMFDEVTDVFYASKEELAARDMDPLTKKIYLENFDTHARGIIGLIAEQNTRPSRKKMSFKAITDHLGQQETASNAETRSLPGSPVSSTSPPSCSPCCSPLGEWFLPLGLLDDDLLDLHV